MSTDQQSRDDVPDDAPWNAGITRYQWLVLLIASLGWVFDVFEGQIFVASMRDAMPQLLGDVADGIVRYWNNVALGSFLVGRCDRRYLFWDAQRPDRPIENNDHHDLVLLAVHLRDRVRTRSLANGGAAVFRGHGSWRRMGGGLINGRRSDAQTFARRDGLHLSRLQRVRHVHGDDGWLFHHRRPTVGREHLASGFLDRGSAGTVNRLDSLEISRARAMGQGETTCRRRSCRSARQDFGTVQLGEPPQHHGRRLAGDHWPGDVLGCPYLRKERVDEQEESGDHRPRPAWTPRQRQRKKTRCWSRKRTPATSNVPRC